MIKQYSLWEKINWVYLLVLAVLGCVWLTQLNIFGVSVGLAAIAIAYFVFHNNRWAYFSAAVWYFGLLRIAMDDVNDFHQGLQSMVKLFYVVGLVIAIILHEKVAIKNKKKQPEDISQ
ncbi:MAG: Na+/H+ antiporter NhaC [Kiritimatiellia bacterium]|jgi:Na+/H+ antiporter NhaC